MLLLACPSAIPCLSPPQDPQPASGSVGRIQPVEAGTPRQKQQAEVAPQPGCCLLGTTTPLQGRVPLGVLHLPSAASSRLLLWKLLKAGWDRQADGGYQAKPHLEQELGRETSGAPCASNTHPQRCHPNPESHGAQRAVISCRVMETANTPSSIRHTPSCLGHCCASRAGGNSGSPGLPAVLGHRKPEEEENGAPPLPSNGHAVKREIGISSEPHPSPTRR